MPSLDLIECVSATGTPDRYAEHSHPQLGIREQSEGFDLDVQPLGIGMQQCLQVK